MNISWYTSDTESKKYESKSEYVYHSILYSPFYPIILHLKSFMNTSNNGEVSDFKDIYF